MNRILFCFGAILCLCILGAAYAIEYGLHKEPCTLCILQRVVLWTITVIFSIALIHNPQRLGIKIYSTFLLILNALGGLIALRHLWLQYLVPLDQIHPCSADLKTLLQFQPWLQVLSEVLMHTQDCAVIDRLLGIPLSLWSLISFLTLFVLAFYILKASFK